MATFRTDRLLPSSVSAGARPLAARASTVGAWLAALVVVDVLLVAITVVSELYPETLIVRRFNLSVEHTIGVWWSSMTLALAAVLMATGTRGARALALPGYVAAALLLGLSLDELGSLHERAPAGNKVLAMLPFALVGGAMLLYTLARWFPRPETRPSAILLGLGFLCFASVVAQEILEHAVTWPVWAIGIRTGIEEGIELLGIALCLLAGLRLGGPVIGTRPAVALFRVDAVPRPFALASVGLALHVVAAFVAPRLGGYPSLGNPAMWFPTVAYGLAAATFLARLLDGGRRRLLMLGLLVGFAGLSAIHAVFIYPESALDKLVWRDAAGAAAALATLVLVGGASRRLIATFLLPAAALAAFVVTNAAEAAFLVAGTTAWATLLASRETSRGSGR